MKSEGEGERKHDSRDEKRRRGGWREEEREEEKDNRQGVFLTAQEDDSDSDDEAPEAFEDNPMPILKGAVNQGGKSKKVKILLTRARLSTWSQGRWQTVS